MLRGFERTGESECELCGKESKKISDSLPLCLECIREKPERVLEIASQIHSSARREIGLPPEIPENSEGVECPHCANSCRIPEGDSGYCNLSKNKKGQLTRDFGTPERAIGSWYRDSHPTNCVASWCCAGGSGSGHPEYAKTPEGDRGYKNAAVFLGTCCYHCLYCQNSRWREMASSRKPVLERDELVEEISSDRTITCLCWFGGTPEPQAPFVHEVSKRIREAVEEEDRILRVCLEANGNFSWPWLEKIAKISLESGGGIKFDLKTWDENLNRVLSGVSNGPTYKNFERLGELHSEREEPPFLRASTLLVPGYIDLEEIRKIARFISEVDPGIPYSLLAHGPAYRLADLPTTAKDFAFEAKDAAEAEGLERVRVGNKHLLR
ncbi:hypothetical protein AKJ66_01865 [candidate division MSBL1 archaeon SCGC-AAA259E22]|uniref:Radical SAM core domain-containing protein n=1 Tax=candidate division MSBL1 archaeon SCGC-AAA259E22 TaxID=1698265 RepID=A0A133UH36_9EURY|nr:hypothetical protein AKJ66_01865 [candidate division MSBL1 archaeon SCGC-AAA259E22]